MFIVFCCYVCNVNSELTEELTFRTYVDVNWRFAARYGCPKIMNSNSASNFRLGSEILSQTAKDPNERHGRNTVTDGNLCF